MVSQQERPKIHRRLTQKHQHGLLKRYKLAGRFQPVGADFLRMELLSAKVRKPFAAVSREITSFIPETKQRFEADKPNHCAFPLDTTIVL